jgi:hypothetical protein
MSSFALELVRAVDMADMRSGVPMYYGLSVLATPIEVIPTLRKSLLSHQFQPL